MPPCVVLEKAVGETPLQCVEAWRATQSPAFAEVPLAYAGRLDPMASGKLLVLIGDECKQQENYHELDKAYDFSVLLGIGSDTHDVLGRLVIDSDCSLARQQAFATGAVRHVLGGASQKPAASATHSTNIQTISDLTEAGGQAAKKLHPSKSDAQRAVFSSPDLIRQLERIAAELVGPIELPYPHFSSKTVQGKPLHQWTLEGRLAEIDVPTKASTIYSLELTSVETMSRADVARAARHNIDLLPEVTEASKALGQDFRRKDVRADWAEISQNTFLGNFGLSATPLPDSYHIAHFHCIASSGTYMRSLAHLIGQTLGTEALAWSIHRTNIGTYDVATQRWTLEY